MSHRKITFNQVFNDLKKIIPLVVVTLFVIACKKTTLPAIKRQYYFSNVLILGNSITRAKTDPVYSWTGNWGMAATVADSDYVHILSRKFLALNNRCDTAATNIAGFEIFPEAYSIDDSLRSYRDSKPDLIIIRIGEDVPADFDSVVFNKRYSDLITYFKTGNPDVHIYAVGSFWTGRTAIDNVMKKYSAFVSLSKLGEDMSNYSWGLYPNPDVQFHPSNKGMREIAAVIWKGVDSIRNTIPPLPAP
ncbi:SGNH/GDSL hydrolase family protein [Mucilaginibacter sp. dw_454]|uniref:SGNH/GDSL hydrolase family protein n=1 Tax=Mucilaginibacter sp. dw_454 TaxID=2720079 RepID=UPI001BD68B7C|nr:SGNH/GDSL hydrolase family protein [Mucilaginibacter sp. dw_454]